MLLISIRPRTEWQRTEERKQCWQRSVGLTTLQKWVPPVEDWSLAVQPQSFQIWHKISPGLSFQTEGEWSGGDAVFFSQLRWEGVRQMQDWWMCWKTVFLLLHLVHYGVERLYKFVPVRKKNFYAIRWTQVKKGNQHIHLLPFLLRLVLEVLGFISVWLNYLFPKSFLSRSCRFRLATEVRRRLIIEIFPLLHWIGWALSG